MDLSTPYRQRECLLWFGEKHSTVTAVNESKGSHGPDSGAGKTSQKWRMMPYYLSQSPIIYRIIQYGYCHYCVSQKCRRGSTLTDHKRVVSTIVCGPLGGIYPYPSHWSRPPFCGLSHSGIMMPCPLPLNGALAIPSLIFLVGSKSRVAYATGLGVKHASG